MIEEFNKYIWDDEEIKPPALISERAVLKSWLKIKIKRIPLSKGAINSRIDKNYTAYEIENIRKLFTEGQLHNLFPDFKAKLNEEEKKAYKKKWGTLILNLFYIFLSLKLTIYILETARWELLLVLFLIVWNLFLKRLWYPIFWSIFGVKDAIQGRSNQEIYELRLLGQSHFKTYVTDSLITPSILLFGIYIFLSVFNFLKDDATSSQEKIETFTSYYPCECADISYKVTKIGGVDNATLSDLVILNSGNKKANDEVFMSKVMNCDSFKKSITSTRICNI